MKPAAQQNTQMASIETQPSLRRTMLDAQASGNPVAALNNGVITTAKGAKPRKQAAQGQAPKAIQVSSEVPDRALSTEQVAETAPAVTPAVLRNAEMRTAPTTVYTAGFQQSLPVANADKFTGKAVTFLHSPSSIRRTDRNGGKKNPSLLLRSLPPHKGEGKTVAPVVTLESYIPAFENTAELSALPSPLWGGTERSDGEGPFCHIATFGQKLEFAPRRSAAS